MRACAVEMHVKISQEGLHAEIHKKMPSPRTRAQTLSVPAQLKRTSRFHKSHSIKGIYRKISAAQIKPRTRTHTHTSQIDFELSYAL